MIYLAISSDTFSDAEPVRQEMKILDVPYRVFNRL